MKIRRPFTDPLTDKLTALPDDRRAEALRRFNILHQHLIDEVHLTEVVRVSNIPLRTQQRWTSRYQRFGLAGLARAPRSDAGQRKMPLELIEGLALHKSRLSAAAIHRRIIPIVKSRDWPVPSYGTIRSIVNSLDPALVTLAHDGVAAYRDRLK